MKIIDGLYFPDYDSHFNSSGYEGKTRRTLLEMSKDNYRDTFVDVGAHVGLWTVPMASEFRRVISFEPNPETFACLYLNTKRMDNVGIRQEAVSDKCDMATLQHNREGNSGMWSLTKPGETIRGKDSYFVSTVTIDSMMLDRLSVLKIDAEGHEPAVLRGAAKTISECRPIICAETKESFVKKIIEDFLAVFDYEGTTVHSETIYTPREF